MIRSNATALGFLVFLLILRAVGMIHLPVFDYHVFAKLLG